MLVAQNSLGPVCPVPLLVLHMRTFRVMRTVFCFYEISTRSPQKIQTSKFFLLKRIEVEPGEPENRKQLTELQNLLERVRNGPSVGGSFAARWARIG